MARRTKTSQTRATRKAALPSGNGSGPWLAGVKTDLWICYVCINSKPTKPGWTPYAAMAERFARRKDAELAARTAVKVFELKGGVPVLQNEQQPFAGNGMECEALNDLTEAQP